VAFSYSEFVTSILYIGRSVGLSVCMSGRISSSFENPELVPGDLQTYWRNSSSLPSYYDNSVSLSRHSIKKAVLVVFETWNIFWREYVFKIGTG